MLAWILEVSQQRLRKPCFFVQCIEEKVADGAERTALQRHPCDPDRPLGDISLHRNNLFPSYSSLRHYLFVFDGVHHYNIITMKRYI